MPLVFFSVEIMIVSSFWYCTMEGYPKKIMNRTKRSTYKRRLIEVTMVKAMPVFGTSLACTLTINELYE